MLVTKTNKKNNNMDLTRVLYIYYLHRFQNDINKIQALLDFSGKFNTITPHT